MKRTRDCDGFGITNSKHRFGKSFAPTKLVLISAVILVLTGCDDSPSANTHPSRPIDEIRGSSFSEPAKRAAPHNSVANLENADPTNSEPGAANPGSATADPIPATTGVPIVPTRSSESTAPAAAASVATDRPSPDRSPAQAAKFGESDRPGYVRVTFNELAGYDYDPFDAVRALGLMNGEGTVGVDGKVKPATGTQLQPGAKGESSIPKHLLALTGKKVCLEGFAMPIEVKGDQARSFLLLRNQMACCFGAATNLNEWVLVETEGKRWVKVVQDVVIHVYGTIDIGEDVKDGMIMSLYRLTAEDLVYKGGY